MLDGLNQKWDLDAFFPGGSESPQFSSFLDTLETDIASIAQRVSLGPPTSAEAWVSLVNGLQEVRNRVRHSMAFVGCLNAQDVHDRHARVVSSRARQINSSLATVMTAVDAHILALPEAEWQEIVGLEALRPLAYNLQERRDRAHDLMDPERETLATALSVDGYGGWSDLYDAVTGRMTIAIEENGKAVNLSPGQAQNRMSDPDPALRAHIMQRWEDSWAGEADLCALALNRLAGFRLALYKQRGWDSFLKDPLEINRMTGQTLEVMWDTINRNKDGLVTYMKRKKQLLGLRQLGWQDVGAPIGKAGSKMTYDEAANFIVEHFARFNPAMAEFAVHAFNNRWIEAEDRPGKRMGGFCTSFPLKEESRIFVTFSGFLNNVSTVAHELGHGFHQSVMFDLPPLSQQYAMIVAETASTFSEMIVADAAVNTANTTEERLVLIEDKLQRAVSLLMNIQARFIFEKNFYEQRKKGMVSVERLNALMIEAQTEAFAGSLDLYHPHFWASKLHFYNTGVPFYNFPYTFGYLFSAGVYSRAKQVGPRFAEQYRNLLRDTGRMRVEDLAKRYLDADLTQPEFWQTAIDSVLEDLPEFLSLTDKV